MIKTPEATVYEGMFEVRPGSVVRFSRRGLSKRSYWSLQAAPHTDDYEATVSTVRELLFDAVGRQMVADVPVCTLLSGGSILRLSPLLQHSARRRVRYDRFQWTL